MCKKHIMLRSGIVDAETSPPSAVTDAMPALLQACRALLAPLAELAIARGLRYGDVDEVLRVAFVEAALAAHPEVAPQRAVSRVSTATGLHRREVSRLIQNEPLPLAKGSPATQVFTRWLSDPAWRVNGHAVPSLPRRAPTSFETLAQSVTKDVHPRSLLEELCRLGLARVDEASDRVERLRDRVTLAGDEPRRLGFVASNVGDHLRASVANVLATDAPPHLEQAVFADELSHESVQRLTAAGARAVAAGAAHARPRDAEADRRRPGESARARPARARGPVLIRRGDAPRPRARRRDEGRGAEEGRGAKEIDMKVTPDAWRALLAWLTLILFGLLVGQLIACGGVDSGGTGQTVDQPVQASSAGRISGFGSVIVNGVRFDDAQARIVDDAGVAHARADLKLGMVVDIEGEVLGNSGNGVARNIQFGSEIVARWSRSTRRLAAWSCSARW